MNVWKSHLRIGIVALLESGVGQREIERRLGVSRKTIRRYQRLANSPTPATGSGGEHAGDLVVVTQLLDRLMHHGYLLRFEGKSWRM